MNRYNIQDPNEDREEDSEQPESSHASTFSGSGNTSRPSAPYRLTGDFTSPSPAWTPALFSSSRLQRQTTNPSNRLPPKALCDRLFAFYLEGHHPILPLIHTP